MPVSEPHIRFFRSNDLDLLVQSFVETLPRQHADPFEEIRVILPNKGLGNHLKHRIAEACGVMLGIAFPYPRRALVDLCTGILGDEGTPDTDAFFPSRTVWQIYAQLAPAHLDDPVFAPVRNYLEGDRNSTKRLHLAREFSQLLDRYVTERPELVAAWLQGRTLLQDSPLASERTLAADEAWQAELCRRIRTSDAPRGRTFPEILARLQSAPPVRRPDGVPPRIHVFNLESIPPLYRDLLVAYSRIPGCALHVYAWQPTDDFWSEQRSERERARLRRTDVDFDEDGAADDAPCPLLASLGQAGRTFAGWMTEFDQGYTGETDGHASEADARFVDKAASGSPTLLQLLQSAIHGLHPGVFLRAPELPPPATPRELANPAGTLRTLAIHSCHTPLREVEVLRDTLLDCFERMPDLRPRDILVLMPDPATYAPHVEAVFSAPVACADGSTVPGIPYTFSDRPARQENALLDCLLRMLDLAGSRAPVTQVFDLLQTAPVRAALAIGEQDLARIEAWLRQAGIHADWSGESVAARLATKTSGASSDDAYALERYTWSYGLQSLLLGTLMPAGAPRSTGEPVRIDGVLSRTVTADEEARELLGRFANWIARLHDWLHAVSEPAPRTARDWAGLFSRGLDELLPMPSAGEYAFANERKDLADALIEMATGPQSGITAPLDLPRRWLADTLADSGGHSFLSGKVAFCAFKPMRTVPARVIAILGLDEGEFPPQPRAPGYDLSADLLRRTWRTPRHEGKYLFLQTLFAAREVLHISHVGQSIRDNKEIPPSSVVAELLEYLGKDAAQVACVRHPLHAYGRAYFEAAPTPGPTPADDKYRPPVFTYSSEAGEIARLLAAPGTPGEPAPEFPGASGDLPDEIDESELLGFLESPTHHYLRHSMGIRKDWSDDPLSDEDPIEGERRTMTKLRQAVFARLVADKAGAAARALDYEDVVELPRGCYGDSLVLDVETALLHLHGKALGDGGPGEAVEVRTTPPLACEIQGRTVDVRVVMKPSEPKAFWFRKGDHFVAACPRKSFGDREEIAARLHHLLLQCTAAGESGAKSTVHHFDEDDIKTFDLDPLPRSDALARLARLVALCLEGRSRPLPFFLGTSVKYVEATQDTTGRKSLSGARSSWSGFKNKDSGIDTPPESREAALCHGDVDTPPWKWCSSPTYPDAREFGRLSCELLSEILPRESAGKGAEATTPKEPVEDSGSKKKKKKKDSPPDSK